jgi:uncharacterized membrane protein YeaQ/YmgE (transglycosylase-associated protein family)
MNLIFYIGLMVFVYIVAPILISIGAIAGWRAGLTINRYGFGLIGNIVVGIIGAVISGWFLPRFLKPFQTGFFYPGYPPGPADVFIVYIAFFTGLILIGTIAGRATGLIVRRSELSSAGARIATMLLVGFIVSFFGISLLIEGLPPLGWSPPVMELWVMSVSAFVGGGLLLLLTGLPGSLKRVVRA